MTTNRRLARAKGEDIAAERELVIPIDPLVLAQFEDIEVSPKPTQGGVSGFIMRAGSDILIMYSTDLDNEGRQRFSVAHELGHYFLPGHIERVLAVDGKHESRAEFRSKEPHEIEADQFAVGLLLPLRQFEPLVSASDIDLGAIERLASHCKTSLTMTAIRVAECSKEALAVISCSRDGVEFCVLSDTFRDMPGLGELRPGESVPDGTPTAGLVQDAARVAAGRRDDDSIHLHDWFGSGPSIRVTEQVVGLGRYGRTLTVLIPEDAWDEDEEREDEELIESWTPKFRR